MLARYYKISIGFFLFSLTNFLFSQSVLAAELFFQAPNQEVRLDDFWEVSLLLDTKQEAINALSGQIIFPVEQLDLIDIKEGGSLIDFWLDQPQLASQGVVEFSGIITGGYTGRGQLFKLVFKTKQAGTGLLSCQELQILLNDGQGTKTITTSQNFSFTISSEFPATEVVIVDVNDLDPPELFSPIITQIPEIAGDDYLLIFSTQDKGSGMNYYEIKEGRSSFVQATSPYVLKNQGLNKTITIRAVDKVGNERLVVVEAVNPASWYEKIVFFAIILIMMVLIYWLGRVLWRRKKQK